ncbi:hypothetical protein PM082_016718 [Marasmius tenuissimus]|nr:hypothetical protein PM082_016718 [Marasmius tenuissimus]
MESPSENHLASLVISLSFECLIPPLNQWRISAKVVSILHRICGKCPNLVSLSFDPALDNARDNNSLRAFFDPPSPLHIPAFLFFENVLLRELTLGPNTLQYLTADLAEGISNTMETLSITLLSPDPISRMVWPRLKRFTYTLGSLQCCHSCVSHRDGPCISNEIIRTITNSWSMPSLQEVKFLSLYRTTLGTCTPFLNKYSSQLVSVNTSFVPSNEDSVGIAGLLVATPQLRHLVLSARAVKLDGFSSAQHSHLRYLDIWGEWQPAIARWKDCGVPGSFVTLFITERWKFPSLERVRLFDMALEHVYRGAFVAETNPRMLAVEVTHRDNRFHFDDLLDRDGPFPFSVPFPYPNPRYDSDGDEESEDADYSPSESESSNSGSLVINDASDDEEWDRESESSVTDSLYDAIAGNG